MASRSRERRVVVKAEIRPLIRAEERIGEIGKAALIKKLVPEDPLIPDIDAGVAAGGLRSGPSRMWRSRGHENTIATAA
jgi:hypothetical protein